MHGFNQMAWTPLSLNWHLYAMIKVFQSTIKEGDVMQEINVIGLDLANNIFHVYAANRQSQTVVRRKFRRNQMHSYFRPLSACLIGME